MTLRSGSFFVILAALVFVAALGAAPAYAQQSEECEGVPHCGPFEDDPTPGGPGGGSPAGGCWKCKWIPFVGLGCEPVSEGRAECDSWPSNPCYPHGAFCEIIIVEG